MMLTLQLENINGLFKSSNSVRFLSQKEKKTFAFLFNASSTTLTTPPF